jgi:Flp pilus assembly protein TadG
LLVEFSLAAAFCAMLLAGAVSLLRLGRQRQVLQSAARLGTLLQSRRGVSEAAARAEVARYLEEERMADVLMVTGRYLDTNAAAFYDLVRTRLEKGPVSAEVICEREDE